MPQLATISLLSDSLDPYFSAAGTVQLAEENTLPGTLLDFAAGYRDGQAGSEHTRFNVGVGIALGMGVSGVWGHKVFGSF